MDVAYIRKLNYRLVGIISTAIILALSVIVMVSLRLADSYIVPELEAKAVTQGQALTALIQQPLSYGIGLGELVGVNELFASTTRDNPEFGFLAITDGQGAIRYHLGNASHEENVHMKKTSLLRSAANAAEKGTRLRPATFAGHHVITLPIFSQEQAIIGLLHIGIKSSYVNNILHELLLDLAVILVVSLFVAYEILYFISGGKMAGQFELLSGVMSSATDGDFSRRPPHIGRDELGRVAALVDGAIAGINRRFAQLRQKARQMGLDATEAVSGKAEELLAAHGIGGRIRFGEPGDQTSTYTNYLGALRASMFLSFIAEDLSRSFIPIFTKQLYRPIPGVSAEFAMGLPIMVFMLLITLLMPVLATWSERVGRKHSLLVGALIGCLAYAMTANAFTIYDLLLWRALAGVSWGIIFVASQGLILDHATVESRTRDIAFFVSVFMVAALCGPPIGGILADNIGFRATFYVSAALSLAAATVLFRFLPGDTVVADQAPEKLKLGDIIALFSNRRFLTLVLTAAIPAKIALISICYYLIPLYVTHMGYSSAMAGRVLMIYGLMMVLGLPVTAKISDRMRKRGEFVAFGLLVSGLSGFFVLLGSSIYVSIAIVFFLGLAHAASVAPQTAIVADICGDEIERFSEGTVYGIYRLMERIGNILGPALAAFLLNLLGFRGTFGAIGLYLLVCGAVFIAVFRNHAGHAKSAAGYEGVNS